MLVPGMSRRMAHEFEEYRPYTSIEQFRREIGKYVDDDEVARFERYVTFGLISRAAHGRPRLEVSPGTGRGRAVPRPYGAKDDP